MLDGVGVGNRSVHFACLFCVLGGRTIVTRGDLCDQHDSEKRVQGTPSKSSRFFVGCFRKISRSKISRGTGNCVFMYKGQGAADMAPE